MFKNLKVTLQNYRFLILLVLVDLLLLVLHFLFGIDAFIFNLDEEHNIPVIWQGFKIIVLSFYLFVFLRINKSTLNIFTRKLLNILPFLFIFLAIDELAQIHEKLELTLGNFFHIINSFLITIGYRSTPWLVFYIPIFILGFFLSIYFLKIFRKQIQRTDLYMVILVAMCFVGVIIFEYFALVDFTGVRDSKFLFLAGLEEFLEMVGISILLQIAYSKIKGFKLSPK